MKKVILIGGGGHAMSVLELVGDMRIFAGYADMIPNEQLPIPFLGTDNEVLAQCSNLEYTVHHVLVYTKEVNMKFRAYLIDKYKNYNQYTIIADSAIVTRNASIGQGSAIMQRSVVNCAIIGESCIVNTGAIVEHSCNIGNNVFIGPGAIILGDVSIGNNCFIGAGVIIRDGVKICHNVVIGMGAHVLSDITVSGTYVGNPIRRIK